MNRRAFIVAAAFVALVRTALAREVHGSTDSYAAPGIALAWAVLRGAGDAATVVIRVVADPKTYASLVVAGIDPFTRGEALLQPTTAIAGAIDVRTPRARFADLPRTEIRLYVAGPPAGPPALTVFYLGIPDTTPEFTDSAKLDAYLTDRIARARAASAKGTS